MNNQKITSLSLIIIGSFLEIYFYFYRFNSDSGMFYIPIIQGVGLTLLLIGLFRLRKNPAAWLFIIPLFLFSVFSTSSGQRQQLVSESQKSKNSESISILQSRLDRKLESYNEASGMKSKSFETVQEMAQWRTTVSTLDIDGKDSEIEDIENQIMKLKEEKTEEDEVGKLYLFYENLLGIKADIIQIILQFSFSFFIAIMAPVGILLYPGKEEEKTDWYPLVKKWVNTNWIGVRNNSNRHILSKDKFLDHHAVRGFTFRADLYDRILSAAIKIKCVDKDTITLDNEIEAIEAILSKLRK